MTELERRTEYNKEALKAAEIRSKRKYANLIVGMELPDECTVGKGILAVTDDVHNSIEKSRRYSPVLKEFEDANGQRIITQSKPQPAVVTSVETPSLEDLL